MDDERIIDMINVFHGIGREELVGIFNQLIEDSDENNNKQLDDPYLYRIGVIDE